MWPVIGWVLAVLEGIWIGWLLYRRGPGRDALKYMAEEERGLKRRIERLEADIRLLQIMRVKFQKKLPFITLEGKSDEEKMDIIRDVMSDGGRGTDAGADSPSKGDR